MFPKHNAIAPLTTTQRFEIVGDEHGTNQPNLQHVMLGRLETIVCAFVMIECGNANKLNNFARSVPPKPQHANDKCQHSSTRHPRLLAAWAVQPRPDLKKLPMLPANLFTPRKPVSPTLTMNCFEKPMRDRLNQCTSTTKREETSKTTTGLAK